MHHNATPVAEKENELNAEQIAKLKELALAATKGPWMVWPTTACNGEYTGLDVMTHDGGALITEETHPSDDDALFIAAANPAAILELIALAEHSISAQNEVISDLNAINRAMQHMGDQLNEMDVVEEEDVAIVTPGFEAISRLLATPSPSLAVRDVVDAARSVLREALDAAEVHPCDTNNDDARARQLSPLMQSLYKAMREQP